MGSVKLRQKHALVFSFLLLGALAVVTIPLVIHRSKGGLASGFGYRASIHEMNSPGAPFVYEEPLRAQLRAEVRERLLQFDLPESTRAAFFEEWDRVARVQGDAEGEVYFYRPQFNWWWSSFGAIHYNAIEGLAGELNRAVDEVVLQAIHR